MFMGEFVIKRSPTLPISNIISIMLSGISMPLYPQKAKTAAHKALNNIVFDL